MPFPASWWENLGPEDLTGIPDAFHGTLRTAHARDPRTSTSRLIDLAIWAGEHKDYDVGQILLLHPKIQRSVTALSALASAPDGVGRRALALLMEEHSARAARDRGTSKATLQLLIQEIRSEPQYRGLVLALSRHPTVQSDSSLLTSFIRHAQRFVEPCLRALAVLRRRWLPDTTRAEYRGWASFCPPDPKRKIDGRAT
ncbi:MAG: hypothetical protein HOP28_17335 [Gemmatimonadales bacterium]|nr:hypothetical protein [Gemmatimonadales bacterium]